MPGHWLKSLRLYLSIVKGSLELDKTYIPPLQRQDDSYIMDRVLQARCFTNHEICQINHCRMYLQAITLSDLALANGYTLGPDMLLGRPGPRSSTSSWIHINQAHPHEASFEDLAPCN
jgi:hypothetical protein